MPFGRDSRVVPSNIVLDRSPGTSREIWGFGTPVISHAAYHQILLTLIIIIIIFLIPSVVKIPRVKS